MKTNMRFSDDLEENQQEINNEGWSTPKLVGFWFLVIMLAWILGGMLTSCKKKEIKPQEQQTVQPSEPKGNMEGEYIWFAGDTAVSNLILTTDYLNKYNPSIGFNCDRYSLNHPISDSYGESSNMMIFSANWNKDTINISTNHWYRFVRKK